MERFLNPRSVALVGASHRKGKVGGVVAENLLKFQGKVYFINPKRTRILGKGCYPRLRDVPEGVDLCIIAVPASLCIEVVEDCGEMGITHVIVLSGGFSETGEEGKRLEERIISIAKRYGIEVLGPNTFGVYNPSTGLDTFFNPASRMARAPPGNVALVSQSGAVAGVTMDIFAWEGIGVHSIIALGNKAVINEGHVLEYLLHEGGVDTILLYLESISNGRALLEQFTALSEMGKRVVVLKGGRTEEGLRAATSHTGQLVRDVGTHALIKSLFNYSGAYVAEGYEEALDAVKALSSLPRRKIKRLGIITTTGGFGIMAVDAVVEATCLKLPPLPPELLESLEALPSIVQRRNPLDLTGTVTDAQYIAAIEAMAASGAYDILMVFVNFQIPTMGARVIRALGRISRRIPLICVNTGGEIGDRYMPYLRRQGVLTYRTLQGGINALKALDHFYMD